MGMLIQPSRFGGGYTPPPDNSDDPHRYWRLLFFSNSSNVASIGDVEFRGVAGGDDLTYPGIPVVSTGPWSDSVALIFDASLSSFIYNTTGLSRVSGHTAGVDFGADPAAWPVIQQLLVRNANPGNGQGPTGMVVQYSDDGGNWGSSWSFITDNWPTVESRVFTKKPTPYPVFEAMGAAVDTGPFATVLTPFGNAAIVDGRFTFDGNGDYYQNLATSKEIAPFGWQVTVEIFDILALSTNANKFEGLFNAGSSDNRILLSAQNGTLGLWSVPGNTISITNALSPTVPRTVKLHVDGGAARLFVDGVLRGSGAVEGGTGMLNQLYLGVDPLVLSARSFTGSFSGVKITQGII